MMKEIISFPDDFINKEMICISEGPWEETGGWFFRKRPCFGPQLGDTVTVLDGYVIGNNHYFILRGWSKNNRDGYNANTFVFPENFQPKPKQ